MLGEYVKKTLNASGPSEHATVRGKDCWWTFRVVMEKYFCLHLVKIKINVLLFMGKRHSRVYPGQNATQQGTYLFTA